MSGNLIARAARVSAVRGIASAMLVLAIWIAVDALLMAAFAQANPFGGSRPPAAALDSGGVVGWLLAKQAEFYRAMSAAIRAAKTDGSAVATLLGVSFLYGIFHAAGPGHGKAVISSYMIANGETVRRGVVLSFVSALFQALVAVVVVGVAAWLFSATSQAMCNAERVIELASYALIAALGARLVWSKGRGFFAAVQRYRAESGTAPARADHHRAHGQDAHDHEAHHDHAHHHGHDHGHAHAHAAHVHHVHDAASCDDDHCGHAHGPDLATVQGPGGWQRGLSAMFAVGLRPCSGAILVLVFALAQGLFWAGVAATFVMGIGTALTVTVFAVLAVGARDVAQRIAAHRAGAGAVAVRFLEFGAAGLVLLLGIALLLGQYAAERVTCF